MNILILEDEYPAAERLMARLRALRSDLNILAVLESVDEARAWFAANPAPDLAFFDIRLADGTCFDLFDICDIPCPVVFCTAHDEFALQAFNANGIAYLLKPVDTPDLAGAFSKLEALSEFSQSGQKQAVRRAGQGEGYKTRLVVSAGNRLRPVPTRQIRAFQARDKGVVAHLDTGESFFVDYTLSELETALDPAGFFRISRAIIVAATAINGAELSAGRWIVTLDGLDGEHSVSRQRVTPFRRWLSD